MTLARNTGFILLGLLIDGLQAAVSWGIATIAAFPGTVGGGAAGCAVGNQVAGQIGCWIGGGTLAIFGTVLNPALATVTIPIGIVLGIAINMCISIVFGWFFLVPLMFFFNHTLSWKRLTWGGGEMIPGLNNIPFWTLFVLMSLWKGAQTKQGRKGVLALAGFALAPTRGIMNVKEGGIATLQHAKERGERWGLPVHVPEAETIPQPTSARELIRTAERTTFRDIRPAKPNAQTA